MRRRSSPAGTVMVSRIRLNSVLRAAGRALSTTAGRKQRPLVAEKADHVLKTNFSDVQNLRHEQAKHSVLISCPPKIHETKFLRYLSQHGEVASHFFFDSNATFTQDRLLQFMDRSCCLTHLILAKPLALRVLPYGVSTRRRILFYCHDQKF